jgi:hypothetical protein
VTGDYETAVLLLGGTFDLAGGATTWPARGARQDPFTGRPMAVYLPPRTEFRTSKGRGEILLVAARQPQVQATTGRELLAQKPLLPMAGSGKSFDPNRGEWMPAETFPSAPESLPPRRFERIVVGACTLERVFAASYKATTLSVDEVVVPAGATLALHDIPGRRPCDEVLLFVRGDGARLVEASTTQTVRGDAVFVSSGAGEGLRIESAAHAPTYVAIAYAGKGN